MLAEFQITLPAQTIESAEPKGKRLLEMAKANLGFIPNMYANKWKDWIDRRFMKQYDSRPESGLGGNHEPA